jgi:DNA-directed RNA polymerase specialized sigma24 family protein
MDDVKQARYLLEQERDAVLRGLNDLRRRYRRISKTLTTLDEERQSLMVRGRAAGVPIVEMAEAVGTSRRSASNILSQAQEQLQSQEAWELRRTKGRSRT